MCALVSLAHAGDLFRLVEENDVAGIRQIVRDGADVNAKGRDGKLPLHIAVEKGNRESAKVLMEFRADASRRNREGFSPFFVASVVKQDLALTAILMKTNDNFAQAVAYPLVQFGSEAPAAKKFTDTASLVQQNPRFGYRFIASPDWEVQVIQDGLFKKQSIVVLTLPPIWSDVERQQIKNAISLFAIEDKATHSLADAVDAFGRDLSRGGEVTNRREVISNHDRYVVDFDQKDGGLVYRRRGVVLFKNGIRYDLIFTATPGTFEKNIAVFSAFCHSIQFQKPTGL